jgi:choline-sulfatase
MEAYALTVPNLAHRSVTLVVLAILTSACSRQHASTPHFPNAPVILISVDTLRADHLPAYGYTGVATPDLDAFRNEATLFRNAYASAPMTLPSHLTMLTGLLPPVHGVRDNVGFRFDASAHPTIPSLLHKAGYTTGAAVSSHVLRGDTGLAAAFDFYEDSIEPAPGARFRDYQRPGSVTEALAEKWIDQQKERPFFFFFHIYEPHVPYDPPEPFRTRYASNEYDGEIAASDAIVGALLDYLRKRGIYDRALIIFVSDHGEGLGDHGEAQHSVLIYRETIHVPLMIKLPRGAKRVSEIAAPVSLADLLPTVTSLLGIRTPEHLNGLPLFGALPPDRAIYSESLYARLHFGWGDLESLTDRSTQYIDSPRPELYDVVRDPAEKHDLAQSKRRDLALLRGRLARFPSAKASPEATDPEEKAKLSALGYVSGSASSAPSPVNPVDRIGDVEALQQATRLAANGQLPEARARFRDVLAKNPGMVEGFIQFGDALMHNGKTPEAIEAYRSAVARSPRPSSDLLLSLGAAYMQSRDFAHAAECGQAALTTNPHAARILIAESAMMRGDLEAAAQEMSALERLSPSDLVLAAEIEQRKGHLDAALAILDKAQRMAVARREGPVYRLEFLRADTYARMNRLEEATTAFEKEIASFPGELAAYSRLVVVRAIAGDRKGAAVALARMLRANPTPAAQRVAEETRRALAR